MKKILFSSHIFFEILVVEFGYTQKNKKILFAV